jgi:hypothetical protein
MASTIREMPPSTDTVNLDSLRDLLERRRKAREIRISLQGSLERTLAAEKEIEAELAEVERRIGMGAQFKY